MTHCFHQLLLIMAMLALASAGTNQLYARFGGWSGGDTLASLSSDLTSFTVFSAGRTSFAYGVGYCDGWMWGAEPANKSTYGAPYQVVKSRVDDGTRFEVGPVTLNYAVACDSKSGRIYTLGLGGISSMKTDGSDLQSFFEFPTPWPGASDSVRYLMVRGDVAYYLVEGHGIRASSNKTGTTTILYPSWVGGFDVRDDGFIYFANSTTLMRARRVDGSDLQVLSNSGTDMRGLAVYGQKILVGDGYAAYTFNLDGTGKTRMFNYTKGYGVGAGCVFTYDYQATSGGGGGGGGAPASPSSAVRFSSVFQGLWQAITN